jgi:hypothetical protein
VATHAALAGGACVAVFVYSVGRHPAVLANAICTIDHLSGGGPTSGSGPVGARSSTTPTASRSRR